MNKLLYEQQCHNKYPSLEGEHTKIEIESSFVQAEMRMFCVWSIRFRHITSSWKHQHYGSILFKREATNETQGYKMFVFHTTEYKWHRMTLSDLELKNTLIEDHVDIMTSQLTHSTLCIRVNVNVDSLPAIIRK